MREKVSNMKWAFNKNICDPFSGSSTTGIAANLLHRKFIGIEKENEFIQMSIARKNELDSQRKNIESRIRDLEAVQYTNYFKD